MLLRLLQRDVHIPIKARQNALVVNARCQSHDHPFSNDTFEEICRRSYVASSRRRWRWRLHIRWGWGRSVVLHGLENVDVMNVEVEEK